MTTGIKAIQHFLSNKVAGERLIVRQNKLHLINGRSISLWICLKAQFGYGPASMKKVAQYVHKHRNNLFPQEGGPLSIQNKNAFNAFIKSYNAGRLLSSKKAISIGEIEAETITTYGLEEWANIGINVTDAPPLPANLKQMYRSPCPFWKGKTIGETHMLVLIPKKLGDKPTTSNRLKKLSENYFSDEYRYHIYRRVFKDEDGHKRFDASYWILMTKDVVPGTLNQLYSSKVFPKGYEPPTLIEAHTSMLTQYLRGRKLTKKSTYLFHKNLTMCQERKVGVDYHFIVGGCNEYGLTLYTPIHCNFNYVGMAAVKKL